MTSVTLDDVLDFSLDGMSTPQTFEYSEDDTVLNLDYSVDDFSEDTCADPAELKQLLDRLLSS